MKVSKLFLAEMILPFLVAWFFMTLLVDIVAIPTVFRNVSSLVEGAKIGMILFGKFNKLEIIMGFIVLLGTLSMKEKSRLFIFLALVLLVFAFLYTFKMTPLIANNSQLMHSVLPTDPQYEILQKNNRFYHDMYRSLDTTKLILLLVFQGLLIHFKIKKILKESV
jgi:hypothetical protein